MDGRIALLGGGRRLPAIVSGVVAIGALALVGWAIERALETPLPNVPALSRNGGRNDATPVPVTITAFWQKVEIVVPTYAVRFGREPVAPDELR